MTTIVVNFTDGSEWTFVVSAANAGTITDDGSFLKFTGKRNGEGPDKKWKINLAHVKAYSLETSSGDEDDNN